MPDKVGQQIGNYRLVRLLGSGGFAEVYLGQHVHVQRLQAAVKILHANLPSAYQGEFLQEADTIADLKHPHIIRILDFGIDRDNAPYLIMDYASNGTLRDRHPKGSIVPPGIVVSYVKQIAEALQYAHDRNLVHRDLKPENLLIGYNGEILVSDFGIATVVHSTTSMETGIYAGTAFYSSPEQIQGKPRPASDQYSLGIVVYEWLTGERPFMGTLQEVISQHLGVMPRPLREKRPDIPPMVEYVVMKALTKDPKDRFRRIQAFATAFEHACMSPNHIEPLTQPAPASQIPTVLAETQPSQHPPFATPVTGVSARTGRMLSPRGKILTGVILLLVVLLSVIGGVGVYNTHISQVNASATATVIPRLTATAEHNAAVTAATATATAAVTPTVNPNAPYGGVLIVNDSLQNESGLNWHSDPYYCAFAGGSFHVRVEESHEEICEPGAIQNLSNLAFEVQMTITKGSFGGLAIRFNHKTDSGYVFIVGYDGTCYLYLLQNGSNTSLGEIVTTDVTTGLGQKNTIAASVKGSTITLYVNGKQIDSVIDTTFTSGVIGLVAESLQGHGSADVAYNNAKVWKF